MAAATFNNNNYSDDTARIELHRIRTDMAEKIAVSRSGRNYSRSRCAPGKKCDKLFHFLSRIIFFFFIIIILLLYTFIPTYLSTYLYNKPRAERKSERCRVRRGEPKRGKKHVYAYINGVRFFSLFFFFFFYFLLFLFLSLYSVHEFFVRRAATKVAVVECR